MTRATELAPFLCCTLVLVSCGGLDGEPEGEAETSSGVALACGQSLAVATISASTAQPGNGPAAAIDGNLATRWSGLGKGASLTAKLGAAARLCSVQLAWYRGDARVSHVVVSTSTDGTTFTDALAFDSSGKTTALETSTLPSPRVAQYVRVTVNGNTENDWASITELRLLGSTDFTAPETTLAASGPAEGSTVTSSSAAFAFSASESGATFECRLNAGAWAACVSPRALSNLAPGASTFSVRAIDAAGNVDATPATRHWTVAQASTRPGPANTGVPAGVTLTRHDGNLVVDAAWLSAHPTGLPAGAGAGVIDAQDIFGTVRIKVPNVTLKRSRIRGAQTQPAVGDWVALVFVTAGTSALDQRSSVVIEDCEVAPSYPSPGSTGIYGQNFTARRNDVHHTVDGFGLHWFTRLEGNWVHDLTFFDRDTVHTNGTHNDCVQLHDVSDGPVGGKGGQNVVVGNVFEAFIAQDAGTPATQATTQWAVPGKGWDHQAMSGFMVNANFKNTVTDNWVEGGYYPVNAGDGANAGGDLGTWQRNQFDRMRTDDPGAFYGNGSGSYDKSPRLTLVFKTGAAVNTGAGTTNANRFEPQPVTSGITGGAEVLVRFY
ncbi:MAG: discoidin domain-containing protein [Myxococcaceae bacterium]|nr:discoidin domain-containing protein [Myxococcaceae bacterium]